MNFKIVAYMTKNCPWGVYQGVLDIISYILGDQVSYLTFLSGLVSDLRFWYTLLLLAKNMLILHISLTLKIAYELFNQ